MGAEPAIAGRLGATCQRTGGDGPHLENGGVLEQREGVHGLLSVVGRVKAEDLQLHGAR